MLLFDFYFFAGSIGPFIWILIGLCFVCFWYARRRRASGSFVLACFVYLGIMFVVSDVGECLLSLSVCVW